jgi:hypothetical protein
MRRWWRQFWCKHSEVTNKVTVSGYGYTEYRVWFCNRCARSFIEQTREQQ